jgi:predicted small lipoprotein YifL
MKKFTAVLVGLVMVTALAACGKQPVEDINATKAAVEAAAGEGAAKYVAADYKKVNDELAAALAEVKVQDEKWFKNYDKAKQLLATAKTDAEALKVKTIAEKERLKQQSIADLAAAQAGVAAAKTELSTAPRGKGTAADIEAMKADVAGLEAALAEIQPLIDSGEFVAASEKAVAINDKAAAVAAEVAAVKAKMSGKKKK